jgi:hypothetical protein
MIKSIKNGYVTFEWDDGETHCLKIDEYIKFNEKQTVDPVRIGTKNIN